MVGRERATIISILAFFTIISGACLFIDLLRLPPVHPYNISLCGLLATGILSLYRVRYSPTGALAFYVWLAQPCIVLMLDGEAQLHPEQGWGALTMVPLAGIVLMYLSYDTFSTLVYTAWAMVTITFLGLIIYQDPGSILGLFVIITALCFVVLIAQGRHDIQRKMSQVEGRVQNIERRQRSGGP